MTTTFDEALAALARAGVPFRLRRERDDPRRLPEAGELDLWIDRGKLPAAERALRGAGFYPLRASGHGPHRFFLAFDGGRWMKLDVKFPSGGAARASRASRLARARPPSLRRLGPVVAILGPDGAGKGTLIAKLAEAIPAGVSVRYLGRGASGGDGAAPPAAEGGATDRPGVVLLAWKTVTDLRRLMAVYLAAWRGHVVLCDRHPIEVLAVRPERTRAGARFERFVAMRLLPAPDALVVLDAPAEVLHARKAEHPVAVLERWRGGYANELGPRGATVVSTEQPLPAAVEEVSGIVWEALRARRRW